MKGFAQLYSALDETTKTNEKIEALATYFRNAPPDDAAWAIHFLIGRRIKRLIESRKLVEWAIAETGVPEWIFGECYFATGDFAETIALLLPEPISSTDKPLRYWVEERLLPLREWSDEQQRESMVFAWLEMDERQRFVWNKLITGEFRVGVSQNLVMRSLAEVAGVSTETIAHRLMGDWQPTAAFYEQLVAKDVAESDLSRPYPFFLAYPIEGSVQDLGDPAEWLAEWKWDGIRSQVIRRAGQTFIWTRGEELATDRFPEIVAFSERMPDGTAIDGEIMPWKDGMPLPFTQMQRRIGRKTLGPKILAEVPVALLAYDLLEWAGEDIRASPIEARRGTLAGLVRELADQSIALSESILFADWDDLAAIRLRSRERSVEGVMLKRKGSPYRVGRRRGDWWKWKIDPYTVDCVLIYAQPGNGKRASLLTDYTFGVWDKGDLVPFAKAYSGLTNDEISQVDAWIRRNTIEKFGPVRKVKPELVFELAFEAIQLSSRHKSGIAVRFPRMARWRTDKRAEDADSLDTIRAMLGGGPSSPGEPT
ncbi:MAG TPA: ATP-dependent DNA ligase [Bryobacteraceae bacterium]|nr:ATP-dependent DNA ligase [Bryobacteraceae bacterium]